MHHIPSSHVPANFPAILLDAPVFSVLDVHVVF